MAVMEKIDLRSLERVKLASIPDDQNALYPEQVVDPSLYIMRSGQKNQASPMILLVPGGGYNRVALAQCFDTALWLNQLGWSCAVLEYRLPEGDHQKPLEDLKAAWLYLRKEETNSTGTIQGLGIMGFSAGGQLAANWSTLHAGDKQLRPDFSILLYPVIDLSDPVQSGLAERFLGKSPSGDQLKKYSAHLQVGSDVPPMLILLSDDDSVVSPDHSVRMYHALNDKNSSASLHIFPTGGHAWCLGDGAISGRLCNHAEPAMAVMRDWLSRL